MNITTDRFHHFRRRRTLPPLAAAVLVGLSSTGTFAQQQAVADDSIVASYTPPAAEGLACSEAARQTTVSFEFRRTPFQIRQLSLYVDGRGVSPGVVQEVWPRVTLIAGLHPGRNLVEVVATGDGRQSMQRQLVVLIGEEADDDDVAPVEISCLREYAQSPDVIAATPPVVVGPPVQYVQQSTVFVDDPVYIYHPVPVYPVYPSVIPFISVVVGSPPVYSYPSYPPPYYPPPPPRYPPPPVVYPPPAHHGSGAYIPGGPQGGQVPRPPPHSWQPGVPQNGAVVRTPPHDPGLRVEGARPVGPTVQWNTPSQNTVHYDHEHGGSYPQRYQGPPPQHGFDEPTRSVVPHGGVQSAPRPVGPPPPAHFVPSAPAPQSGGVSRPPPRGGSGNGAVIR
jgi:hypothetical protein